MTRQEAISFSKATEKPIRHRYFSPGEYVFYKDGKLIDEEGYVLPEIEFWSLRSGEVWENDWEEADTI